MLKGIGCVLKKNDGAIRSMPKKLVVLLKNLQNWLFQNEPLDDVRVANEHLPRILFFCCIVFYGLYLLAMQSAWVLGGEMWAEMATNYYPNAASPSFVVKFFSTDAGYIPLPQRILAAVGNALHLPAAAIPHFYTWTAILATAAMVGAFCLTPFRQVVKSDFLRFFAAISILLVADFESRTFINFTYFVAFFVAIISALAFVQKSDEVPWWSWSIPVLMLSKPAVLSALPGMILVAFFSKKRFRSIAIVVVVFCLAQILRMVFSHSAGAFVVAHEISLLDKLWAATKYSVGFLGAFFAGKATSAASVDLYRPVVFGVPLLGICIYVFLKVRINACALIFVGLGLLVFNVVLNVFALGDLWNLDMQRLVGVPLYRHIIVGYFGVILIVVGLIEAFGFWVSSQSNAAAFGLNAILFLFWFEASGWADSLENLNRAPMSPVIGNSQWQKMALSVDSGSTVCVPIDPLGWMYGRDCLLLNSDINWGKRFEYRELAYADGYHSVMIEPSELALNHNLLSLAVLLKPSTGASIFASAEAIITMKNGNKIYFFGDRQLPIPGGVLLLTASHGNSPIATNDVKNILLRFDAPVDLGYVIRELNKPAVLWMGR